MSKAQDYTVGWVAPTTTDFVAAQQCLDARHEVPETAITRNGQTVYAPGKLAGHNVVIAAFLGDNYGPTIVMMDMLRSFPNIRIVLSVDVGGGAPTEAQDVRLGDVVVGRSVIRYDYDLAIKRQDFHQTMTRIRPPPFVQSAVLDLRAQHKINGFGIQEQIDQLLATHPHLRKEFSRPPAERDRLFRPEFDHFSLCGHTKHCQAGSEYLIVRQERGDDNESVVHYGSIATARLFVRDARFRDEMASDLGVICFARDAPGFGDRDDLPFAGPLDDLPFVVIRGICDYADSHRNNEKWEGYAAMAAAVYAKNLLGRIDPIHLEAAGLAMPLSSE